jgi:hypothetical protein
VVPFLLDTETGKTLPRKGVQKGRAAFFDLIVQTYWGGVVTNDEIEIDWGQCRCGRNTPFIKPTISRSSQVEMNMGWTSEKAMEQAKHTLRDGLVS